MCHRAIPLLLTFFTLVGFAQQTRSTATCNPAISISAFDEHWVPLNDLHPESLRLQVGGREIPIQSFRKADSARVAFVLDGSGSMMRSSSGTKLSRWQSGLNAAIALVSSAPDNTEFAAVTFGAPGDRELKPTNDRNSVIAFLTSVRNVAAERGGHTPLYDNIEHALRLFGNDTATDAVFLMTDGLDNESRSRQKQLLSEVGRTGTIITGILFYDGAFRTPEETSSGRSVLDSARDTGGWMYEVPDQWLAGAKPQDVAARMRSAVLMWDAVLFERRVAEVREPDNIKSRTVKIRAATEDDRLKRARLLYQHTLPMCGN